MGIRELADAAYQVFVDEIGNDDGGLLYGGQLVIWYFLGGGDPFLRGEQTGGYPLAWMHNVASDWGHYMAARPQIRTAMRTHFASLADEVTSRETFEGDFMKDYRGIRLDSPDSMMLTLNGCHRLSVFGRYRIGTPDGTPPPARMLRSPSRRRSPRSFVWQYSEFVSFYDVRFIWHDHGGFHPNLESRLRSGATIRDSDLESSWGENFDVRIHFRMPGISVWGYGLGGQFEHLGGWPPT